MDSQSAKNLVINTFENGFNKAVFLNFIRNLVKKFDESKAVHFRGHIKDKFKKTTKAIKTYERLGTYTDPEGKTIDILVVYLEKAFSLDYARTTLRNFVAEHLKDRDEKDAALVAFLPPENDDWRFSLVKMEYQLEKSNEGKLQAKTKLTPAKRFSYLVGKNENSYTAKNQFLPILVNDQQPLLSEFETAFNVEKVTKEFFAKYHELFIKLKESLDNIVNQDERIKKDFEKKKIDTTDFAKKLLGQIVFLYFLQKKGWFGVDRDKDWGSGSKQFLRQLFDGKHGLYKNFFNDILEPLFYQALRTDRSFDDNYFSQFNCKIPFLNGGLFDPINDYDWIKTDILLPNNLFSNNNPNKEGDTGDGILDIFDRYNFTVKEDEPLEKEVAIDPEMLGKVFENLLAVKDRKSKGTYYTPREIVHYMCQQSLINYLATELKDKIDQKNIEALIKYGETTVEHDKNLVEKGKTEEDFKLPKDIVKNAKEIDDKLADIRVCDPAVGSGAFLVGMMSEIIKARNALTSHLKNKQNRSSYSFKRQAIEKSLYGVDIDLGAVEIAKLRLWLSLIVDEEDIKQIKPLPNLDYKIMQGNSLIEYITPESLTKTTDHVRGKLIEDFNQAKQEYLSTYEPGQKKAKRDQINKLIEDIMIYDKKRQIETDRVWKKYAEQKNQESLYGEENKQLAIGLSEKEKERLNQQIKEFDLLKTLSPLDHFEWHLNFNEIFDLKKGFDIIIANPPYFVETDNKLAFEELKNSGFGKKFYEGRMDFFYFFIEKSSLDLSHTDSTLTFITTNYWLTSDGAKKFRNYVRNNIHFIQMINFNEIKIFETAQGQHNLIFIGKKIKSMQGKAEKTQVVIVDKFISDLGDFTLNFDNSESYLNEIIKYETSDLFDDISGHLIAIQTNPPALKIKRKLEKNSIYLKNNDIGNGIDILQEFVTKNHLLSNPKLKPGEGIFILSRKEIDLLNLSKNELSTIKPFYSAENLFRYSSSGKINQFIIYANQNFVENISNYPKLKNHLEKFKSIMTSINKPYGLNRPRDEHYFKGEKLLVTRMTNFPKFSYVADDSYVSRTFLVIKIRKLDINLKYLVCIFNSRLGKFWFYNFGKRKGNLLQIDKTPLLNFPIKEISEVEQEPFVKIVNQILEITSKENYDPKNPPQEQKLLEAKIDQMVYKLYGLSPKEVKIVEGNT